MQAFFQTYGDQTFTALPLGEVDALVFSQLCYLHFRDALQDAAMPLHAAAKLVQALPRESGNAAAVEQRHALLDMAAASKRFGNLTALFSDDRFDIARDMQFAAVTFTLPDGTHMLCYRGTDATLVGWREDFAMSYASPVPSQLEAVRYLQQVALNTVGALHLCGHSKGGNLALYAAACCMPEVRSRIADLYLFDAPGVSTEVAATEGYTQALPKVRCFLPQTSIIGRLMVTPEPYTVVRSNAFGLTQHNVFTWALEGAALATLPTLDGASQFMSTTIADFMRESTPEARQTFVETLFTVLGAANAHTLSEMADRWTDSAGAIWGAAREVDAQTRKALLAVAGSLANSGMESARKWLTDWSASILEKPADITAEPGDAT